MSKPKPFPPPLPVPGDCCGSGCIPCVIDIYAEALVDYEAALAHWRAETCASSPASIGLTERAT